MTDEPLKRWRVTILNWSVYEVPNVEARNEEDAEEKALATYKEDDTAELVDGGVNSVEAEEEEA